MMNALAYYMSVKLIAHTQEIEEERILDTRLSSVSSISDYYHNHTTN